RTCADAELRLQRDARHDRESECQVVSDQATGATNFHATSSPPAPLRRLLAARTILPQLNLRPLASLRAVQGTGIARPSFSTSQPRLTAGRSAIDKYQRLTLGCSAKSTVCQAKREIQGQMAISAME